MSRSESYSEERFVANDFLMSVPHFLGGSFLVLYLSTYDVLMTSISLAEVFFEEFSVSNDFPNFFRMISTDDFLST